MTIADNHFPALLTLLERVGDLKVLPRTGWLLAGVAEAESIADHTAAVALTALFLAETINANPGQQGLDRPLDVGVVVKIALIHDLAESVLTDLPKRSSRALGDAVKHAAEAALLGEIMGELTNGQYYFDLWRTYERAATPESRLVKDVDKLEMVAQALRYTERGHTNLREFWHGHHWHFPLCHKLYNALIERLGS